MPHRTELKLKRIINAAAFLVATTVGLSLPSLYYLTNYKHEVGAVDTLAYVQASLIPTNILKTSEETTLASNIQNILAKQAVHLGDTKISILNSHYTLLASNTKDFLASPILSKETPLYEGTTHVGYVRVERSLKPLLIDTTYITIIGILLAMAIAVPLRSLPLRALRRSEKQLDHATHHDALTDLPNRTLLDERLELAIKQADADAKLVTVIMLDLDNFKNINDSLGHSIGDELLKQTAGRLLNAVSNTDTVVRLGGDEFVIVLPDQDPALGADTITLQKIRTCLSEPFLVEGQTLRITSSMGLASYPNDGDNSATLLKNADTAMYRAKDLGRNNFQFFTEEMNEQLQERMALQQGLLNALSNNELRLVYQPQINLKTGNIVGVETLLRWEHPELGMVSPAKFIPVAEDTGLIVPIGEWVLRTACKQNKLWQTQGLPPIKMSVNVSPRQFKERDWAYIVASALKDSGLSPEYLELEITESLIMENVDRAIAVMKELQDMGVQLSIDDFGTGYSSLSSLKHFPVARLKIDQSFIKELPGNHGDKSIAMAVIALGHNLNLKVIAEGVETEQQQAFLRANACDEMQGYYFSKPVSPSEVEKLFIKT